jgi:hypothetical protein
LPNGIQEECNVIAGIYAENVVIWVQNRNTNGSNFLFFLSVNLGVGNNELLAWRNTPPSH